MKNIYIRLLKFTFCSIVIFISACDSSSSDGGCPGSIISSCVDYCPENCEAKGLTEVCVGAGYEPNRCCYCE
jgi:hypothetical protein